MSDYERRRRNREYEYDWDDDRNSWQGRGRDYQGNYEEERNYGGRGYERGRGSYGQRGWGPNSYEGDYDRGYQSRRWRSDEDEYGQPMTSARGQGAYGRGWSGRGSNMPDWRNYEDVGEYGTYQRSGMRRGRSSGWQGEYGRGSRTGDRNWEFGDQSEDYEREANWMSNRRWGQQGRYSGVGPQGYQRSDARITEDINDRLTWHGDIDATNIRVSVKSGEVTLEGTVADRWQKRHAEDVIEDVMGVTNVQNNLKVEQNHSEWNRESMSGMGQRQSASQPEKAGQRTPQNGN